MQCSIMRAIHIEPGEYADYKALAGFHYVGGRVVAVTRIFRAIHIEGHHRRLAGVAVEALPLLASKARDRATHGRYRRADRRAAAAQLNAEVRNISRVIVHPVYRGMGLAVRLVQHLLAAAQTPYVEAFARMGRIHPFLENAGMQPYPNEPDDPLYYLWCGVSPAPLEPVASAPVELGTGSVSARPTWNR